MNTKSNIVIVLEESLKIKSCHVIITFEKDQNSKYVAMHKITSDKIYRLKYEAY